MARIQGPLERVAALAASVIVLGLMFLTTADVVGRYAFNQPVPGAYEISELLLIGIVFLPVASVQSLPGHIRLEVFESKLTQRARLALDIFGHLIGLFIMSIMTWQAWLLAWRVWVLKEYSVGIVQVPVWPAKAAFVFGIGLLCTRLILDIMHDAFAKRRKV